MKKILLLLLVAVSLNAQVLDKVIAVVDNEIILKSELEFRVNMEATQRNMNPADSTLRRAILNSLIEEKLMYAQAEMDTIKVTDEQVTQQLEYQINYFIQQYGSREKLEQVYGMPIEKIKRSLQEDTRKNIMAQMLQQKKFGQVESSRKEVEEFFSTIKDSLPIVQQKFHIYHIFQNPKTGERIKQKARDFAKSLLDSIKGGKDFAELAKKYSDDPGSQANGGDLGFQKRGVLVPEFEATAYALAPNQLSNVVESPFGFHIIQMIERRGDAIHARHILIKIKADDEADLRSIEFLNDIRDSIVRKVNTFDYYAKKYSDDKENARFGGEIGTFESSQLDKGLTDVVYKLKEGDLSYPKRIEIDRTTYGYHIVKLAERIPEHKANLDLDYPEIKRLSDYAKKQKLYAKWMKEIKEKIYWEIRS
ncbi:MAG: Parvulin-like peptidyl-prolyl isomerase [Stygiobacter sp.]|nr:MAG: Parvulin-like peptidyl-prolyl isomerase [Stygiobacter sp.]KAF0213602.1 MAG: Parvulin-like peptidyl-prolyl [Ignavibacteria bacterium]